MIERILAFSLKNRGFVIVLTLGLVVGAIFAWQKLTLDAVPDITTNQVQIFTETGGMSPSEVERLVTFPIETAMSGIPGTIEIRSQTQFGLSIVTVTFRDNVDIYFGRSLVTERLNNVKEDLPEGVAAPELGPVTTGLGEVYMYDLDSKDRSIMELREYQDWVIAPQLRGVTGVAEVNAMDGHEKEYQFIVNPQAMLARAISFDDLVGALQKNNRNAGGGLIERNGERVQIRSVGMATTKEDIGNIVVKTEGGTPVLVKDLGHVEFGSPILSGVSTRDGRPSLIVVVMMLKGANGRDVANAIDARIKEIRRQLPGDLKLETLYSRANLVDGVLGTVSKSLLEGAALVVAILLLLLGNWRGAVIVALAIPLSMMFAIIWMERFGISGNLMSLGAIDFGLIVDGAVVMIENAVRRLAEAREHKGSTLTRQEVRHSVWEGSKEVARPTVFAVLIITSVYLPILALEGTEGKMFKPMAFTVVFALLGALALTLTLVPVMASLLLSGDTKEARNPVMAFFSRVYRPALDFGLRRRWAVLGGAVALLAMTGWVFTRLGSEFVPQLDEGSLVVQPTRLRTVDVQQSYDLVHATERKVLEVPEVYTIFSRTGTPDVATDPMPLSLTDSFIMYKPKSRWRKGMTKEKLREEIEEKVNEVPGQSYSFTQPIQMRFDELVAGVKAQIGIKVFGDDLQVLKAKADEIAQVVRGMPGASDVEVEQVDEVPVLQIDLDRSKLARLGLNVDDVQSMIAIALGGETVGQIVEGDRRFGLAVRFPAAIRNDPKAIGELRVATPSGGAVQLRELATIQDKPAPAQISREMGKRRVVVQLNVRGRDLGGFVAEAQRAIQAQVKLPEGTYLTWGGQFENLQRASQRLAIVVPIALAIIFLLLFTTFGSLKQALIIFTGVPLAITGGVLGLALRGMPLSITAGVGFIALSGVAVLNGVVMLSAFNRLREQGRTVGVAVREGAAQRLRPVLMTALVASLGFVPMALNTGLGAEVQRPLATVVIGGIVSSTLLTLVVLPVLYAWFERDALAEAL
ncbi:MAG: CusA/CzcA family heavy metal efflux RND transporter [Fimbriimonadaceae bacterium]|nr:CusA/CzcA family heavy metal efflux RND transporter [Fimbriimonadaceae bacterium]